MCLYFINLTSKRKKNITKMMATFICMLFHATISYITKEKRREIRKKNILTKNERIKGIISNNQIYWKKLDS